MPIIEPGTAVLDGWLRGQSGAAAGGAAGIHGLGAGADGAAMPAALLSLLRDGVAAWRPDCRLAADRKFAPTVFAGRSHGPGGPPGGAEGLPSELAGGASCGGGFKFRYIELFAGIGGFRLGLDAVGGSCVFSSEIE